MEKESLNILVTLTSRDLQIASPGSKDCLSYNIFKRWLTSAIVQLLQKDFDKLINILYRIDINEPQAKEAFLEKEEKLIAEKLAELILKREQQKIQTREKYKGF